MLSGGRIRERSQTPRPTKTAGKASSVAINLDMNANMSPTSADGAQIGSRGEDFVAFNTEV